MTAYRMYTGVLKVDFDGDMYLDHDPMMINMLVEMINVCYASGSTARDKIIYALKYDDYQQLVRNYYRYRLGAVMVVGMTFDGPGLWWAFLVEKYWETKVVNDSGLLPVLDI